MKGGFVSGWCMSRAGAHGPHAGSEKRLKGKERERPPGAELHGKARGWEVEHTCTVMGMEAHVVVAMAANSSSAHAPPFAWRAPREKRPAEPAISVVLVSWAPI